MTERPAQREAAEITGLIEEARGGSRQAFDQLVRRFDRPLLGYLLSRTRASDADAEDLAQEVWMQAFEQITLGPEEGGYDPEKGTFFTFLRGRYARFAVLRWREGRGRSLSLDREGDGILEPSDHGGSTPDRALQAAERLRRTLAAFEELFRHVFLCGGYPHQQLTFGFSKLLYGKPSERGLEGTPETVHVRHGDTPLDRLLGEFLAAYRAELSAEDEGAAEVLDGCLAPLRSRLPLQVGEIMGADRASAERFVDLAQRPAGETALADYYGSYAKGHASAIPDWCYKVEKRVRAVLGLVPQVCARCKLRDLPPCGIAREKSERRR